MPMISPMRGQSGHVSGRRLVPDRTAARPLPALTDGAGCEAAAEPRLGALREAIGFHLRLAHDASFLSFSRKAGQAGLKPGRFTILMLLGENGGLTPTALSRVTGRDKSTITQAIRDLEALGLIRRQGVPQDRRSFRLELTESGHEVLADMKVHAEAHERALDRIVGAENKPWLLEQLRRIACGVE